MEEATPLKSRLDRHVPWDCKERLTLRVAVSWLLRPGEYWAEAAAASAEHIASTIGADVRERENGPPHPTKHSLSISRTLVAHLCIQWLHYMPWQRRTQGSVSGSSVRSVIDFSKRAAPDKSAAQVIREFMRGYVAKRQTEAQGALSATESVDERR